MSERIAHDFNLFNLQASNVFALSELEVIAGTFNKAGIALLLLKGASLLETVYQDKLDRSICDLDILVHTQDLSKTNDQMLSLGYNASSHNWGNHVSYTREGQSSIPVEIHWDLFNRKNPFQKYAFKIETGQIWDDAELIQVGSHNAYIMSPEHQLFYLSCHLIKESFNDPKWIRDIDMIVRFYQQKIDWTKVINFANYYKVRMPVCIVLNYVKASFDTPIPVHILQDLANGNDPGYAEELANEILQNKRVSTRHLLQLYLAAIEKPFDRIRAITEYLPYILLRSFMTKRSLINWKRMSCYSAV